LRGPINLLDFYLFTFCNGFLVCFF
jgi:hypothetical protein